MDVKAVATCATVNSPMYSNTLMTTLPHKGSFQEVHYTPSLTLQCHIRDCLWLPLAVGYIHQSTTKPEVSAERDSG